MVRSNCLLTLLNVPETIPVAVDVLAGECEAPFKVVLTFTKLQIAVKDAVEPSQMVWLAPASTTGKGLTVTEVVAVEVQLLAFLTVMM